ncbi:MAG: Signal recognition particle 54 kDa protein [Holosporales bacterium]
MVQTEFLAPSMREALNKAKEVLGEDAYIISSEQTEKGVKIFATIQDHQPKPETSFPVTKQTLRFFKEELLEKSNPLEGIRHVIDICQKSEISGDFCDAWLELLAQDLKKDSYFLDDSFAAMIPFNENWIHELTPQTPVIVVGSPGCGKTSVIGKLAVILKSLKKNVHVITLDTQKAGAYEQIKTYVSPLQIPLDVGYEAYIKAKEFAVTKDQIILVDTPGINILSDQGHEYYFKLSQKIRDPLTLVMPSDLSAKVMQDIAAEYMTYKTKYVIGTRFDTPCPLGNFLNMAYINKLIPILYADSEKLSQTLKILSAKKLLLLLQNNL